MDGKARPAQGAGDGSAAHADPDGGGPGQRLLLATRSASIAIWELDVGADAQVWDDRMYELFGVAREAFPGGVAGWAARLHPEDAERVLQAQAAALAGTGTYDLEYRILLPDGSERHLKADAVVIRDEAGRPLRMIGSNRDITAGKLAEQALRQSRERFHRLFDEVLEGIAVADLELGVLVDCNRAFEQLTGYGRKELLGAPIARLHPEACFRLLLDQLREVLDADGGGRTLETLLRTRTGEEKEIQIRVNPVTLGHHRYAQGLFTDLTERRRLEREREATVELLRLLNQPSLTHELIALVARFLQGWTGCEAVGIRLREDDDFPYYETRGFPADFVRAETSLCARDAGGAPLRDPDGNPVLDCMCGNILCGRFDPGLPFFTPNGSFWSNCTTELLAGTTAEDRQARTRNRCNGEGYESVALIPLRSGTQTLGLLQVNDRARDRFTPELIQFLERTGHQLGLALAQRQAQEALRISEARFRDISGATSDFLWETDIDGKVSFISDRVREVLGYEPGELIGRNPDFLAVPEQAAEFRARRAEAGDLRGVEVAVVARSGQQVWVTLTRIRRFDDQGAFAGYRGAGTDITRRKRAEAALKADLERFQALLRIFQHQAKDSQAFQEFALAEALQLTGSQLGFICACSEDQRQLQLRAWSPEVMARCAIEEPRTCFDLAEVGLWAEAIRQRQPVILNDCEAPHPLKRGFPEGHVRLRNFLSVPILAGDRVLALVGMANKPGDYDDRDVVQVRLLMEGVLRGVNLLELNESLAQSQAEVRRMNEALELQVQRRTAQFEAANKELEAFSYSVSHDLRAPLRAIDGFSQVLLEDYGERLDEDGRRYLQRVRLGTQRMGNLIEDLLKLSRLSRGELERRPLDLSGKAERILRDLAQRDPDRAVATAVAPGLTASGDARLVTIALENLLGNSWKYTARTPGARIEFGALAQDGQPAFFVRDNGAGFDMAYAGKLFSPFQRLHAAPEFEGSGIGLALVQRILNRHGGRIWAEAEPDLGATFYFTLPA